MSLINESDFQKIESFAETVSKPGGDQVEQNTKESQNSKADWRFLWDRYSPENKYYTEYLSRLRKIKDADEILFDSGNAIEDKRVNIRRKCMALIELKRCNLSSVGEKKVGGLLKSISVKTQRDGILRAKREFESCKLECGNVKDLFSYLNMKLFYNRANNPKTPKTDLYKHRIQTLYLVNEILATKNGSMIDGLMETTSNEPCNLHVLIALAYETVESKDSHEKIQQLIQVWYRGQFLPEQALNIFSRSSEDWQQILANWLNTNEEMLPRVLKDELDVMIDSETERLNQEMMILQEENKVTISRLNDELKSLGKRFLKGRGAESQGVSWNEVNSKLNDELDGTPLDSKYDRTPSGRQVSPPRSERKRRYSRNSREEHDSDDRYSRDDRNNGDSQDRHNSNNSRGSGERKQSEVNSDFKYSESELPIHQNSDHSSDGDMQIDSDDESLKPKEPFHKTPASLVLKLIPIYEYDVTKPINPENLRYPVKRGEKSEDLTRAFKDFYSTGANSKRDRFGWSPVTEEYSLYHYLKEKKESRKSGKK